MTGPNRAARPLLVSILMALTAVGGVLGILVGAGLILGQIEPATLGVQGAGIPATVVGVGILVYAALALPFAYGAWTLQRWGWTLGLVLWVVSGLSDAIAGLLGYLAPLTAVVQVMIAVALVVYWLRPSVKAAFGLP